MTRTAPARKRFGQHFLHDSQVIAHILAVLAPQAQDCMVEIGPGCGALTFPLLQRLDQLHVVELDRDLTAKLLRHEQAGRTLHVHQADALRFDFASLCETAAALRIVGNLPYNISTPLVFHLITQAHAIRDLHFMLQREVVERMAAAPGSKVYGRLSVMTQYHCRVEPLFDVGGGAFTPPPQVTSTVVRLTPHATPPVPISDYERFARLVACAFSHRRKTLANALDGWVDGTQIQALGIDPRCRPEQIDLAGFARLSASTG